MTHDEAVEHIVYDIGLTDEYTQEVLKAEIRRLRGLLNDCWDAAGLLGPNMTGQPYQAWEEPTDLLRQIDGLAWEAEQYRAKED